MQNLQKKRSDIQIIAHPIVQKQYTQIRGLPASQNGQRRSLCHLHQKQSPYSNGINPLHPRARLTISPAPAHKGVAYVVA
jgi:hypothetical protein